MDGTWDALLLTLGHRCMCLVHGLGLVPSSPHTCTCVDPSAICIHAPAPIHPHIDAKAMHLKFISLLRRQHNIPKPDRSATLPRTGPLSIRQMCRACIIKFQFSLDCPTIEPHVDPIAPVRVSMKRAHVAANHQTLCSISSTSKHIAVLLVDPIPVHLTQSPVTCPQTVTLCSLASTLPTLVCGCISQLGAALSIRLVTPERARVPDAPGDGRIMMGGVNSTSAAGC